MVVLLDMSKAFDSVRHDLMLSKRQSIGVPVLRATGLEATFHNKAKLLTWPGAFHKLLEIIQNISWNFSKSCSNVAQKTIKSCFL